MILIDLRMTKDKAKINVEYLELGGGIGPMKIRNVGLDNYVSMDIISNENVDIRHDVTVVPWPIHSDVVKGIYSAEFMEHISYHDLDKVLSESFRILVSGGRFASDCPDFEGIARNIVNRKELGITPSQIQYMRRGICGDQTYEYDFHRNAFWFDYIKEKLEEHGFVNVKRLKFPYSRAYNQSLPFDEVFMNSVKLCIEAYKP